MPPWLDSAEEVGALVVLVGTTLGMVAAALVTAAAGVVAAWRSKLKPLLTDTRRAATAAAEQLTPNHGSSVRDALTRIETTVDRLDRSVSARLAEVRSDMHLEREQNARRLERLEHYHSAPTPIQENTIP